MEKIWSTGPSSIKEQYRGCWGSCTQNYIRRRTTKLFKLAANLDAQSLSSEATGGWGQAQEASVQRRQQPGKACVGDARAPAWLLTALWPQLWIPVHGVALGKRPALGGLFNDLPGKNKANRLLAAAWMQQESRFLFPPTVWLSRQGIKEKVREGVVRAWEGLPFWTQHFTGSLWMVPGYLGIGASWYFHPLYILVIPNSRISWAPKN